jgi:hypothetical protein
MKSPWPLATLLLAFGTGGGFADVVELNGITRLYGENMAFLVLQPSARAQSVSFALSEGESRFGVKLLAVDVVNGRAEIEQSGQTQLLRLGFAQASTQPARRFPTGATTSGQSPATSPLTPLEQSDINRFLSEDTDAQKIRSGNPPVQMAYVETPQPNSAKPGATPGNVSGGAAGDGTGGSAANPGTAEPGTSGVAASAGGTATSTASASAADDSGQYWYKTSLSIEQNRLATADQVISGDMAPLPATPLTPPGTPASLIGPDTYFSNHIPGFVCGGSVDD